MEATTIRLSNVDFPLNSAVRLNSLKGRSTASILTGSSIPAADQIGRVNFIKNVSSGGNRLNTRQKLFDQYGQNITIGKISNP